MPGVVEITNIDKSCNNDKTEEKIKKMKKKSKVPTTCLPETSREKVKVAVEIGKKSSDSSKMSIDIVSDASATGVLIKKKKKRKSSDDATTTLTTTTTSTTEVISAQITAAAAASTAVAAAPATAAAVVSDEKVKTKKKKKRSCDDVEENGEAEKPAKKVKKAAAAAAEVATASPITAEKKKKKKEKKEKIPSPVKVPSPTPSSPSSTPSSLSDEEDFAKDDEKSSPAPEVNPHEEAGKFSNFNISKTVTAKLESRGIKYLFPVQYKTMAKCMSGNDIIVKARTGSGKTLAFAIPLVEKLQANPDPSFGRAPRALVMSPTRELAKQIGDDFGSISTSIRSTCFYGGSAYGPQFNEIHRGIDVLVGTPGRILDHLSKTGRDVLNLSKLEYVVLDEVDRMLDMGFADDVEKILNSAYDVSAREDGKKPQTLLFSATVPSWVRNIANKYLETSNLGEVDLVGEGGNQTSTTVDHLAVRCVPAARPGIIDVLLRKYGGVAGRKEARAMVFCQTKAECSELATSPLLSFPRQMLSGDVPQEGRERVMREFRDGRCQCLVATDVAARGLDVPEVDMVIQCSPPGDVDSYIHRSGRTGRAGRRGVCICLYGPNEESKLKQVERAAKVTFTRTPAPKAEELMELKKDEILDQLKEVTPAARDVFLDSADALIESDGAREALATALAALSGIKTSQRSLLTGAEKSTTVMVTSRSGFRTKGFVFRILENRLGAEMKEKVSNVSLTQNGDSALFDIPTADKDKVLVEFGSDHREWIEEPTEIPPLQEPPPRFGGGRFGGRGGGGGFRGRGGGGFNRSFGGGGGGFKSTPNKRISF